MEKAKIIGKELLALNFEQAYEVFICKCECWDWKPTVVIFNHTH